MNIYFHPTESLLYLLTRYHDSSSMMVASAPATPCPPPFPTTGLMARKCWSEVMAVPATCSSTGEDATGRDGNRVKEGEELEATF